MRQRVVVGGRRATVTADEAHGGAAITLARVVLEVADDEAQVLQVPVQRLDVLRGLEHDVAQSLDPGGLARRALRGVGAPLVVTEVEHLGRLPRKRCELVGVGNHAHHCPARVGQVDGESADALGQLLDLRSGGVSQPHHVSGVGGPEGSAQVPRARSSADDHARCAGVGPAQLELVGGPAHGGEPERVREPLRSGQVGLAELQPGQIEHLDDGVPGTARVLTGQGALLAVQVVVGPVGLVMCCSSLLTDEIITYERVAQSRVFEEIVITD